MTKLSLSNQELGFPDGTSGKEPICQCRRQETWVRFLGGEELKGLKRAWQSTPLDLDKTEAT